MKHYYNDVDPYVCRWLENLILSDLIPDGDVDGRSIVDVRASDVRGYRQAHFFCGIAGWPLALQLAGWPASREVWTGSCPCQPFSAAGAQGGFDDERHLWPHLRRLIRECRPAVVFGEQVASKAAEPWLDLVLTDLEAVGYAGAAVAFTSASVGAPHLRDRSYWMGYAGSARGAAGVPEQAQRQVRIAGVVDDASGQRTGAGHGLALAGPDAARLADAGRRGDELERRPGEAHGAASTHGGEAQQRQRGGASDRAGGTSRGLADADDDGLDEGLAGDAGSEEGARGEHGHVDDRRGLAARGRAGPVNGFWRDADWLGCRDAKWRPVEPGTFPLAYGLPARVGRLRAYGNAINPHQASEFLKAAMECMP